MEKMGYLCQTSSKYEFNTPDIVKSDSGLVLLAPTGALILMMVYYISKARQLFQIFTQSIDSIDVTSVTLSHLNSINAIDVTRC